LILSPFVCAKVPDDPATREPGTTPFFRPTGRNYNGPKVAKFLVG